MKAWEENLRQRYEQDRRALCDYREIDLEFKIIFESIGKEVKEYERSEYDSFNGVVCDTGICDGERVRTEQDQDDDSGSDLEVDRGAEGESEELSDEMIDEDYIYERLNIRRKQSKQKPKSSKKKKKHKRK